MLSATAILSWTSSVIFAFFALLLTFGSKKPSSRTYALIALTGSFWSLCQGFGYQVATAGFLGGSHEALLLFMRGNHFLAASIGVLFFYFSLMFPEERVRPKMAWLLLALELLLGYLYFGTATIIANVSIFSVSPAQLSWQYGPLHILFYFHFAGFFSLAIWNLLKKWRIENDPATGLQFAHLIWAIVFGALVAFILGLLLPSLGYFEFARYAPAAALLWVALTYYAIAKYQTLSVRFLLPEVALLSMLVILFINIFLPSTFSLPFLSLSAFIPNPKLAFSLYSLANWLATIIFGNYAIILATGDKKKSTRAFAAVAASMMLWSAGMGLYYSITDHNALLFLNRWNHFFGVLVGIFFFCFAWIFPEERPLPQGFFWNCVLLEIVLGFLYFGTDLVIKDTFATLFGNIAQGWQFGPLGFLFHLPFTLFFGGGFVLLYQKWKKTADNATKNQLFQILWAMGSGSLIGVTVAVILPLFGLFAYTWLGPIFGLTWVALTTYVIVKYNTISLKVIAAEIAILVMAAILFVNIFLPEQAAAFPSIAAPLLLIRGVLGAPNIYSLANWVGGIIFFSFGIVLFAGNERRSTQALSAVAFMLSLWSFGAGLYYMAQSPALLSFLNGFDHCVGGLVGPLFFMFAYLFPEEKLPSKKTLTLLICAELLYIYLCLGTSLIISGTTLTPGNPLGNGWIFGPLGFLFHLNLLLFYSVGIFLLYKKHIRTSDPEMRRKLFVIPAATLIGSVVTMTTNVLLPLLGVFSLGWLGAPSSLLWVALISYTIVRYKLFNIRFIIAEAALLVMVLLLFVNIFPSGIMTAGTALLAQTPTPSPFFGGTFQIFISTLTLAAWFLYSFRTSRTTPPLPAKTLALRIGGSLIVSLAFLDLLIFHTTLPAIAISPLSALNKYAIINWALGIGLLFLTGATYLRAKATTTRSYTLLLGTTALWALSTGYSYFTGDAASYDFAVRLNFFLGNSVAFSFYIFSLISSGKKVRDQKLFPLFTALYILAAYLYFGTSILINHAFLGTGEALVRTWQFGIAGLAPRFYTIALMCTGFFIVYKNIDHVESLGPVRTRKATFWTLFITALPAVIISILTHFGHTEIYWLDPLTTIGWIGASYYALSHTEVFPVRIIFAEIGVLCVVFLLFGNIFSGGEFTTGFISKTLVFLAFTTVGIFFIRNIVKSEEQQEELDRLSITLSDLNKNLEAKVLERTRELDEEQTHLNTILENLTNGLVEYNTQGSLIRINKAAEKMLSVKRKNLLGTIVTENDVTNSTKGTLALITHPGKEAHPPLLVTPSPENMFEVAFHEPVEKELQVVTTPIKQEGNELGTLRVLRDVTRENLISRSKSEFISIAAHQLRSPLSVIKWTFSALLSGDLGRFSLSLEEALHQGAESNQRMINLVNDLLVATRIEGGKFDYAFAPIDIKEVATEVAQQASIKAHEKVVTLELVGMSGKKALISGDKEKLAIALTNLLSNAIWYTPTGGTVILRVAVGKNSVTVTIKDSGVGIAKTERERLFSKFYRSDSALRMNPNGSGLGLFIVGNIVHAHKGTIELSSVEHKGTTATITLPSV